MEAFLIIFFIVILTFLAVAGLVFYLRFDKISYQIKDTQAEVEGIRRRIDSMLGQLPTKDDVRQIVGKTREQVEAETQPRPGIDSSDGPNVSIIGRAMESGAKLHDEQREIYTGTAPVIPNDSKNLQTEGISPGEEAQAAPIQDRVGLTDTRPVATGYGDLRVEDAAHHPVVGIVPGTMDVSRTGEMPSQSKSAAMSVAGTLSSISSEPLSAITGIESEKNKAHSVNEHRLAGQSDMDTEISSAHSGEKSIDTPHREITPDVQTVESLLEKLNGATTVSPITSYQEDRSKATSSDKGLTADRRYGDTAEMKTQVYPQTREQANGGDRFLGTNLLGRIGIITLVLGIAFFIRYAIDREWIGPLGRVVVGIATGIVIMAIGHILRRNYKVFSSLLFGGAIAVFYITVTLAYREYDLLSQTAAFITLALVTLLSVILSLRYDRPELAVFSLLGGFGAPLMASSGSGNDVVLFSYLLVLNIGMLTVSWLKGWRIVSIIGLVCTTVYIWPWLGFRLESVPIGLVFILLFFFAFHIYTLLDDIRSRGRRPGFSVTMLTLNNLLAFFAVMYVLRDESMAASGTATIMFALVNGFILSVLNGRCAISSPIRYALTGAIIFFATVSVPVWLDGGSIAVVWAIESVVLLWMWKKTRLDMARIAFPAVFFLAVAGWMATVAEQRLMWFSESEPFLNMTFISGMVLLCSNVAAIFLTRNDSPGYGHKVFGSDAVRPRAVHTILKITALVIAWLVPYLEIPFITDYYYSGEYWPEIYNKLLNATWTICFIGGAAVVFRNNQRRNLILWLLVISAAWYATYYLGLASNARKGFYFVERVPAVVWASVIASIPGILLTLYYAALRMCGDTFRWKTGFTVVLVTSFVVMAGLQSDNIAAAIFGNPENYARLMRNMHTFAYPIIWAICAGILMIIGIRRSNMTFRKISLVFFLLIIAKFYMYDVWYLSHGGRIGAFITLGVILLLVSFLQQKLRKLLRKNTATATNDENRSSSDIHPLAGTYVPDNDPETENTEEEI